MLVPFAIVSVNLVAISWIIVVSYRYYFIPTGRHAQTDTKKWTLDLFGRAGATETWSPATEHRKVVKGQLTEVEMLPDSTEVVMHLPSLAAIREDVKHAMNTWYTPAIEEFNSKYDEILRKFKQSEKDIRLLRAEHDHTQEINLNELEAMLDADTVDLKELVAA